MGDTNSHVPSVEELATHLFAAFHPGPATPSGWAARDVTLGQLRTLFMIRSEGPVSISRVADAFAIGAAAASGYIERIERHGLVERRHRTDDRRIVDCHLTESGRRLLDELAGVRIEALHRALSVLHADERVELDRLLLAIAERNREQGDVASHATAAETA